MAFQPIGRPSLCYMAALGTPAVASHPRRHCRHMQTYADSKVDGWEDRDDITVVVWDPMGHDESAQLPQLKSPDRWCVEDVPQDCIGYVTGNRRAALGGIEEVPASP